jgi:uncharacterized integral membrane protein
MIRLILAAPFLIILVIFALSNPQPVTLGFWPTDYTITDAPLSVVVLIAMAAAFLIGALMLWFNLLGARRRAARAEREARMLGEQVEELKARLRDVSRATAVAPVPARTTALTLAR